MHEDNFIHFCSWNYFEISYTKCSTLNALKNVVVHTRWRMTSDIQLKWYVNFTTWVCSYAKGPLFHRFWNRKRQNWYLYQHFHPLKRATCSNERIPKPSPRMQQTWFPLSELELKLSPTLRKIYALNNLITQTTPETSTLKRGRRLIARDI